MQTSTRAHTPSPRPLPIQPTLVLHEFGGARLGRLETYSPYCLKVRRALQRAGLDFQVAYAKVPGDIKKLNPLGQVPVLAIDGTPHRDSTAIVERIERLCDQPMSAQLTPGQQAEAALWEELSDTALNGYVVASRWADEENWPLTKAALFAGAPKLVCALVTPRIRAQVVTRLIARDVWRAGPEACWQGFERLLDHLEARCPERDYWVGAAISTADLGIFAQLQSLREDITPRQKLSVEKRRRLTEYLDRVDAATASV